MREEGLTRNKKKWAFCRNFVRKVKN